MELLEEGRFVNRDFIQVEAWYPGSANPQIRFQTRFAPYKRTTKFRWHLNLVEQWHWSPKT